MGATGNDRQIDNIEFNVSDIARSRDFYRKAFGWSFTDYGPTYCEFTDGRLTGGLTTGGPIKPGGPLVILYADDLATTQSGSRKPVRKSSSPCLDSPAAAGSISRIRMDTNSPSGRRAESSHSRRQRHPR